MGPAALFGGSVVPTNMMDTAPVTTFMPPIPSTTASDEEAAKQAWLARLDVPTWGGGKSNEANAEEAAKKAWLARLDAPAWGQAAAAVARISTLEQMPGAPEASAELAREEKAKKAWLSKLDTPTWGAMAAAVTEVAAVTSSQNVSEEEAKKAWLARLDAPTWGKASVALIEAAGTAQAAEEVAKQKWLASLDEVRKVGPAHLYSGSMSSIVQTMGEMCDQGMEEACSMAASAKQAEEDAKMACAYVGSEPLPPPGP